MAPLILNVFQNPFDAAAADTRAEELGGEIRYLVCLIENYRIGRPKDVAEAILLQRQIGEQQMVVDDDDIGFERLTPRHGNMTARDFRTTSAKAVLSR